MEYSNHTVNELKGGSISSRIGTFSGNIYGSRTNLRIFKSMTLWLLIWNVMVIESIQKDDVSDDSNK